MRVQTPFPLALVAALLAMSCAARPARTQADLPFGFSDQLVIGGLDRPVAIAQLPDGRVFALEQKSAKLRLIVSGALASVDPVGVIDKVRTAGNEQGALGIAIDPGWPARPYVYVHCDDNTGPRIRVSRYTLTGDLDHTGNGALTLVAGSRYDLVNDIPDNASNHNGGTLRFGTDGMLYGSFGEDADPCGAQSLSALKGTILRLDVSRLPPGPGAAPRALVTAPGNPYEASPDSNRRLLWAKGLRNPFRFCVDEVSGALYIADVGEVSWEEIDVAASGGLNFGWPLYEGNELHDTCPSPLPSPVAPISVYDHGEGRAVVAGVLYRPPAGASRPFPSEYTGRLFYSDYYTGFVWLLRDTGSGWELVGGVDQTHWATGLNEVSDYLIGQDGSIWYCRQSVNFAGGTGSVHRIEADASTTVPPVRVNIDLAPPFPSPAPGVVTLRYRISASTRVHLAVFDERGRRVRTLRAGEVVAAPGEEVTWDGRDERGRDAAPGLYVVRLQAAGTTLVRRVPLLR